MEEATLEILRIGFALGALLLLVSVLRPVVRWLRSSRSPEEIQLLQTPLISKEEVEIEIPIGEKKSGGQNTGEILQLAKQSPQITKKVVREWLRSKE